MNDLLRLRIKAMNLFVKNGANIEQPNVIAAIIEAARHMAMVGDVATKEDTNEVLLESFDANDDIAAMVELLNPDLVRNIIGYSPDYMDFGQASAAYKAQKDEYDNFYKMINFVKQQGLSTEQNKTL